jgi:hypothetical protein
MVISILADKNRSADSACRAAGLMMAMGVRRRRPPICFAETNGP